MSHIKIKADHKFINKIQKAQNLKNSIGLSKKYQEWHSKETDLVKKLEINRGKDIINVKTSLDKAP